MMRSKKALGDFFVIIFVGIFMIFFLLIMNAAGSFMMEGDAEEIDDTWEVVNNELSRFLKAPAHQFDEEYRGIMIAEYMDMNIDGENEIEISEEFDDFADRFADSLCATMNHEDDCRIRIQMRGCMAEMRDEDICRYQSRGRDINVLTEIDFYGREGDVYELTLGTGSS